MPFYTSSSPVRPRRRSRRCQTAAVTAAGTYFAAYGAGVLGFLAIFLHTERAAIEALATALVLAVITVVLLASDALSRAPQPPPLACRACGTSARFA